MNKSLTKSLVKSVVLTGAFAFLPASPMLAQNTVSNAPSGAGATIIYRQVMPNGRIVYSDTATKGVKIDRVLTFPSTENKTVAKSPADEQMRGASNTEKTVNSRDPAQ